MNTLIPEFLKDKVMIKEPQIEVSIFLEHASTFEQEIKTSFPLTEEGKTNLEKLIYILQEASYVFGRWNDKDLEFLSKKVSDKLSLDYDYVLTTLTPICLCDCKFGEAMVAQLSAYQVKYYFENSILEFEKIAV